MESQSLLSTPKHIGDSIVKFCNSITGATPPAYFVPVKAVADEKLDDCVNVVSRKIARDGGKPITGWIIWHAPSLFVEAEFHCIWESPSGEKIDVSPKPDGETQILFLPDSSRSFQGEKIPNQRKALRDHPALERLFILNETWGRRKPTPGHGIIPSRLDEVLWMQIQQAGDELRALLAKERRAIERKKKGRR
jgi:hypothetical protein